MPGNKELKYNEMIYEAVTEAHKDAGINNDDVKSIITSGEDFAQGKAIADEFCVDACGGMQKCNDRICGDSLYALFNACMQIKAGLFDLVLVVGYDKPSEVKGIDYLDSRALDPVFGRPFDENPHYIPGLEMNAYMNKYGLTESDMAKITVNFKKKALNNKLAFFGETLSVEDVLRSDLICQPLKEIEVAPYCDAAIAFVVASEKWIANSKHTPIYIDGTGWSSDNSSVLWYESSLGDADYLASAARQAFKEAKIEDPQKQIDFFEIDDRYSYKALAHLEALGVCAKGEGLSALEKNLPVNVSGGLLGMGCPFSASGLLLSYAAVQQMRGDAEGYQLPKADTALVAAWSGIPSRSGGVMVLSK